MFKLFPKLIAPVSTFTKTTTDLVGEVVVNEDGTIIGSNTKFVLQVSVGSEIVIDNAVIGVVGEVINDTQLKLEELPGYIGSSASAKVNTFEGSPTGQPIIITDIFRRIKVSQKYKESASLVIPYTVTENERIEDVSTKFYGSPNYHWVIIMLNNITDPREDWPLSEADLMGRIETLYPGRLPTETYEYRDPDTGYVVESTSYLAYSVSIFDYEFEKNEAKRQINILQPQLLNDFINDFSRLLMQ